MNWKGAVLVVDSLIAAEDANPQEVKRRISVADQRAAGLNGGGPRCPGCHEQTLGPMPESSLRQCRNEKCLRTVRLRVTGDGLKLEVIEPSERFRRMEDALLTAARIDVVESLLDRTPA